MQRTFVASMPNKMAVLVENSSENGLFGYRWRRCIVLCPKRGHYFGQGLGDLITVCPKGQILQEYGSNISNFLGINESFHEPVPNLDIFVKGEYNYGKYLYDIRSVRMW